MSPSECSMPISAAIATCEGEPPITSARPAAAIEQATPTSPWQPTSAPEMEAFLLKSPPITAEARKKRRQGSGLGSPINFAQYASTAGITPQAPLVGAVTTRPPAAFSSDTASANMLIQSSTAIGSTERRAVDSSARLSDGARRCTLSGPGSSPSV